MTVRMDDIRATERRYTGVRHVPDGKSAYEVNASRQGAYDPQHDTETIAAEVAHVLTHIRYAEQLAGDRVTVYCKSDAVRQLVLPRLTPAQRQKIDLVVSP